MPSHSCNSYVSFGGYTKAGPTGCRPGHSGCYQSIRMGIVLDISKLFRAPIPEATDSLLVSQRTIHHCIYNFYVRSQHLASPISSVSFASWGSGTRICGCSVADLSLNPSMEPQPKN